MQNHGALEPIYKDGEAIWDSLKIIKLLMEASCCVEIDSLGMQSFTTKDHEDEILDISLLPSLANICTMIQFPLINLPKHL